jgi:predicted  nucleic acid-binding Zn-ribbon protein
MIPIDPSPAASEAVGTAKCQSCGMFVSQSFARVFGDNQDRVRGCPECSTFRERTEQSPPAVDGLDS